MARSQDNTSSDVLSITWKWIVWLIMLTIISVYLVSMAIEYGFRGLNYLLKLIIQSKKHDK